MPHCVLLAFLLALADTGTIAGTVTVEATGAALAAAVVTIGTLEPTEAKAPLTPNAVNLSADIDAFQPRRIEQVFRQFVSCGVASSVA